jgi:cyclohexanone monooxygenase
MIEPSAEWIGRAIDHTRAGGHTRIEPTPEAVEEYNQEVLTYYHATIFPAGENIRSWFVGANTPGKAFGVALNFGGFPNFIAQVTAEAERGYEHYRFSTSGALAGTSA